MERSSAALRLPTVPVPVELALVGRAATRGHLFVAQLARAGRTAIAEAVATLLEAHPPFVPAREADGRVVLLGKQALAWVAVALGEAAGGGDVVGDPVPEPVEQAEPSEVLTLYDQQHEVEIEVDGGRAFVGHILYSSPADRPRVIDHLNLPGQFLRLWTAQALYLVNKHRVVRVRELG